MRSQAVSSEHTCFLLRLYADCTCVVQGKTAELEQVLRQKELEIERLQQQLESKKSSGSSDSSVDVCAAVDLDEDPSAAYATEVGSLTPLFPHPSPALSPPAPPALKPQPLRPLPRLPPHPFPALPRPPSLQNCVMPQAPSEHHLSAAQYTQHL